MDCESPKACTVLLRGASKDILNEVERNLADAMGVARNIVIDPRLVPGGGAVEMAISRGLSEKAATIEGVEQWPYRAVGVAMEVIPRTLAQNCGANVIRTLTKLRAKHAESPNCRFGIDGNKGARRPPAFIAALPLPSSPRRAARSACSFGRNTRPAS